MSHSALDFAADPLQLTGEDWDGLTNGAKKQVFKAGDVVMAEGKSYKEMYQILRGKLRVEKLIDGKIVVLGRCHQHFPPSSWLVLTLASSSQRPSLRRKLLVTSPF